MNGFQSHARIGEQSVVIDRFYIKLDELSPTWNRDAGWEH